MWINWLRSLRSNYELQINWLQIVGSTEFIPGGGWIILAECPHQAQSCSMISNTPRSVTDQDLPVAEKTKISTAKLVAGSTASNSTAAIRTDRATQEADSNLRRISWECIGAGPVKLGRLEGFPSRMFDLFAWWFRDSCGALPRHPCSLPPLLVVAWKFSSQKCSSGGAINVCWSMGFWVVARDTWEGKSSGQNSGSSVVSKVA